jgi:methylated-DNA-[protein]-cysteine S-methyltransferase
MEATSTFHDTMPSPVGPLLLTATDAGLTRVYFEKHRHMDPVHPSWRPASAADGAAGVILAEARRQLEAYFAGRLREFDVPLAARGSPFQEKVWGLLREIPWGRTASYGEIARRIGDASLSRAVGVANGRNPLSIVVPCHRVIGADGSLTGYGGGMERKRWLLAHEGALGGAEVLELGL